jgi:hypothetical protein
MIDLVKELSLEFISISLFYVFDHCPAESGGSAAKIPIYGRFQAVSVLLASYLALS